MRRSFSCWLRKIAHVILLAVLPCFLAQVSGSAVNIRAQSEDLQQSYSITEPYDYAAITDSDAWKEMSGAERLAAVQIPDDIVREMTTEALLRSILTSPFVLTGMNAFSTIHMGFLNTYYQLPVIEELVSRDDFGNSLINVYDAEPVHLPDDRVNWNIFVLETFIPQEEISGSLEESELAAIARIAEQKYQEKSSHSKQAYAGSLKRFYETLIELPDSPFWSVIKLSDVEQKLSSGAPLAITNRVMEFIPYLAFAAILAVVLVLGAVRKRVSRLRR